MFRFDPEPSTQHVWLALSRQPVPELEALRKWVNPVDRGTISDAGIAARVRVRLANGSRAVVSRAAGTEVTFGSRQPMYAGKIEIQTENR